MKSYPWRFRVILGNTKLACPPDCTQHKMYNNHSNTQGYQVNSNFDDSPLEIKPLVLEYPYERNSSIILSILGIS